MRPRVFPAEDELLTHGISESARSFNEAAGIPRGRQEMISLHAENGR